MKRISILFALALSLSLCFPPAEATNRRQTPEIRPAILSERPTGS